MFWSAYVRFVAPFVHAEPEKISRNWTEIDNVVARELERERWPGAFRSRVLGDEVIFAKGYGVAHIGDEAPVTTICFPNWFDDQDDYRSGIALSLVEEGQLTLDAPIESGSMDWIRWSLV